MVEIVAEISGNHGGFLSKAIEMIIQAGECDCDYAKFQFYRPEDMPDRGDHETMYRKLMVPDEWLPELFAQARRSCIGLFASVFSVRAVETLLEFDVPYIKIASPDSTQLRRSTYRAIFEAIPGDCQAIISIGSKMEWLEELSPCGAKFLYCPIGHPPSLTTREFEEYAEGAFEGFSDHTAGIAAPLAFIRAGAEMIEKHFKIDDDCVDAAFSADPQTMKLLCKLAHR